MTGGLRRWWRERQARRVKKLAGEVEGIREGQEVWGRKRYGLQWGAKGSGRRTAYDEGKTKDDWD